MLREKFCDDKPNAGFEVSAWDNRAVIKLTSISYNCEAISLDDQQKLQRIFEAEVVVFFNK